MTVALVGAGPGDPELLTVRAVRLLAAADVVLHDRLVPPEVLALCGVSAELIDVGKRAGQSFTQAEINAALVAQARTGRSVVRLKGGDPFVFGRGGEEAEALLLAGIEFEVVPGISSAVAGPASAGIPLTHRDVSSAFTVVTGHRRTPVKPVAGTTERAVAGTVAGAVAGPAGETDWAALAKIGHTLVVLMGVEQRSEITRGLLAGEMAPSTPVAVIHRATTAAQAVLRGRLEELPDLPAESPAVIVIGAVAGLDLRSWASSELTAQFVT